MFYETKLKNVLRYCIIKEIESKDAKKKRNDCDSNLFHAVFDVHHKSPLHWAAEMDHLAFVEFLLQNGGKNLINLTDIYEQTALHYAAESGNLEVKLGR